MPVNRNVPRWERAVRVLGGVAVAIGGYLHFGATPPGWLAAGSGIIMLATGVMGFCPACAIAGRRRTDPQN